MGCDGPQLPSSSRGVQCRCEACPVFQQPSAEPECTEDGVLWVLATSWVMRTPKRKLPWVQNELGCDRPPLTGLTRPSWPAQNHQVGRREAQATAPPLAPSSIGSTKSLHLPPLLTLPYFLQPGVRTADPSGETGSGRCTCPTQKHVTPHRQALVHEPNTPHRILTPHKSK